MCYIVGYVSAVCSHCSMQCTAPQAHAHTHTHTHTHTCSLSLSLYTSSHHSPLTHALTDGGDSVSVSRLVRSLLSGYPNEVDFAFNVLTILSHQGGVAIHCQPHLLAVMLAHVGVFSDGECSQISQTVLVHVFTCTCVP